MRRYRVKPGTFAIFAVYWGRRVEDWIYGRFQRAFAAFLAISSLLLAESLAILAFPPFSPPRRPRATAAGFFAGFFGFPLWEMGAGSPVTALRISNAVTLTSDDFLFVQSKFG